MSVNSSGTIGVEERVDPASARIPHTSDDVVVHRTYHAGCPQMFRGWGGIIGVVNGKTRLPDQRCSILLTGQHKGNPSGLVGGICGFPSVTLGQRGTSRVREPANLFARPKSFDDTITDKHTCQSDFVALALRTARTALHPSCARMADCQSDCQSAAGYQPRFPGLRAPPSNLSIRPRGFSRLPLRR
jgi:hypothetical protein